MKVLNQECDSVAVANATNATATATLAATTGYKWRVTGVTASYSGAAVATPTRATLVSASGFGTIGRGVSTNDGWQQSFTSPIDGADGEAVTLALPAGGAGAVGDVAIMAVKVPTLPAGIKV